MFERLLKLARDHALQAIEIAKAEAEPIEKSWPFNINPAPCFDTSLIKLNPFSCSLETHKSALTYIVFMEPSKIERLQNPDLTGLRFFKQFFPPSGNESEMLNDLLTSYWDEVGFQLMEDGLANWKNIIQRNRNAFTNDDITRIFAGDTTIRFNADIGGAIRPIDLGWTSSQGTEDLLKGVVSFPLDVAPDVSTQELKLLYKHRREMLSRMVESVKPFIVSHNNDPFLWWQMAEFFIDRMDVNIYEDISLYLELKGMVDDAKRNAHDPLIEAFFDLEFAAQTSTLQAKNIEELEGAAGMKGLPADLARCREEAKFSLLWSRLWIYKLNFAWSSGGFNGRSVEQLEDDLVKMVTAARYARRDTPAWKIESEFYLHAVFSLVGGWASPGGPLTAVLLGDKDKVANVEAAEKKIEGLKWFAGLAESIAVPGAETDPERRELLASIQWEASVASYFAAGLFKTGVDNLKIMEKFSDTRTFKENVAALHEKWPWLVGKDGEVLDGIPIDRKAGAAERTTGMFYRSKSSAREVWLPAGAAVACAFGSGPLAPLVSTGCAGAVKKANQEMLKADPEAKRLIDESFRTGLSLVGEGEASENEYNFWIDWAFTLVPARMGFSFNQAILSMSRSAIVGIAKFTTKVGFPKIFNPRLLTASAWKALPSKLVSGCKIAKDKAGKWFGGKFSEKALEARKALFRSKMLENGAAVEIGAGELQVISKWKWFSAFDSVYGPYWRLPLGTALLAFDKFDEDGKVGSLAGAFGAALYMNEFVGQYVMGWNATGGFVSLIGRFGIENAVLWAQGYPINKPDMTYLMATLAASYVTRGTNKLFVYGQPVITDSKIFKPLARFFARHRVKVPFSVVGRQFGTGGNGMGVLAAHRISGSAGSRGIEARLTTIADKAAPEPVIGTSLGATRITSKQRGFIEEAVEFSAQNGVTHQFPQAFAEKGLTLDAVRGRYGIGERFKVFAPYDGRRAVIIPENGEMIYVFKTKKSGHVFVEEVPRRMVGKIESNPNGFIRVGIYDKAGETPFARFQWKEINGSNTFTAGSGGKAEDLYYMHVDPLSEPGPVDKWWANTTYGRYSDRTFHKGVGWALKKSRWNGAYVYWRDRVGAASTVPSRAKGILTVRGALLNTQDLQFIYLTRYAAAQAAQLLGSDVDPEALAKVAFVDNGVAELVTHPYVQHVLGIDSAGGVLGGYAIGFGLAFIFGDIFQTKRKKVPMFDEGNDVSLAFRTMLGKPWHNTLVDNLDNDDYAGAADVMFEGLTSLNISHYISGAPSAAGLTDEDIANLTGTRRQIEPQKLVAYRKRLLELAASADAELESVRLDTAVNPQDQLKAIGEGKFRSSIRIFNYADSVFERAVDYAQAFANGSSPSAEEVRMLVIDLAMLKTLVNSPGTANVKWYLKDVADNLDTLIQNVPDMTYDHTAASFASSLNRGAVNTNSFGPIPIIPEDGSAVLDARPVFMDK